MAKKRSPKKRSGRSRGGGARPARARAPEPELTAPEGNGFLHKAGEKASELLDAAPVVVGRAVNRVLRFFLGGSRVERAIKELCPLVDAINTHEAEMVELHDAALRAKTAEFRRRLAHGRTSVDELLPEAFAVAREACDRRIGMLSVLRPELEFDPERLSAEGRALFEDARAQLAEGTPLAQMVFPASFYAELRTLFPDYRPPFRMRPYDVQLIGGIVLHQGKIAEMVTGEGKTLVATLPAYLNALALNAPWVETARQLQGENPDTWTFEPYGLFVEGGQEEWRPIEDLRTAVAERDPRHLRAIRAVSPGVHIVTVNDYLARRDRHWNAPMFESLGLTVGAIQSDMDPSERHPEYACDITYGTNNEFGFDYLRDNMKDRLSQQVQRLGERSLHYAIIDEVDNILIDEARTPLIISGPAEESSDRYYIANRLVHQLHGINAQHLPRDEVAREQKLQHVDYIYNLKDHSASLTEAGIRKAQKFLGVDNLYHGRHMDWPPYIEAALKAKEFYKLDVDYVIRDGEVIIVDEFTGRLMPGRRWSDGLHQAVEAKEAPRGVRIKEENQTLATITFQNFFRLYDKIAGMTGTALTEAGEFMRIYGLDVVPMPTNRPLRRDEHGDLIYGTEKEKWQAIVEEIAAVHAVGRPILVGTTSIENSEKLSHLLERRGIPHEVLNAKHHEREAGIVALAGQFGAVTVATNMAGRGTDITLGPCTWTQVLRRWQDHGLAPKELNPDAVRKELRQAGEPADDEAVRRETQRRLERFWFDVWGLRKEGEGQDVPDEEVRRRLEHHWAERGMAPMVLANSVAELGGLHIVGTERHEARRIDNQLRGRAGRQGDPGSSRFFVSLDDDLMRIFMAEWVRRFMVRAGLSEGQPLEHGMVTRALERAQRKVEERNFEIRKSLLEYDEVMDEQRKLIYDQRQEILEGGGRLEPAEVVNRALGRFLAEDLQPPSRALPDRLFTLLEGATEPLGVPFPRQEWDAATRDTLEPRLAEAARQALPQGLDRARLEAWARSRLADGRADGGPYPERWQLPRLARWAEGLGLDLAAALPPALRERLGEAESDPRQALAESVREELAQLVAQAAREQLGDHSVDELLTAWFTIGYEQDLPLLGPGTRWELDTFRRWTGALDVDIEIIKWSPATSTCEALLPQWLEGARQRFAGQSPGDVAAELAAGAARLTLAWRPFLARPEAARLAWWADRRLGLELTSEAIEAAYAERVEPRLVRTLADALESRLAELAPGDAVALWARDTARWHLDTHLRFRAHHLIALATHLSARLRVGLSSFHLAHLAPDAIRDHVLEKVAHRPPAQHGEEHLEGLEDILFGMIERSNERLVEAELGERGASLPVERNFAPLADFAHELGLSVTEAQWRAFDIHELRLHFLRQAAEAYPPETLLPPTADEDDAAAAEGQAARDFLVPRFTRRAVARFTESASFRAQPSYEALAAWAVDRFPFLPREAQVESHLKRFAEDHLGRTRTALVEAKVEEYQQAGVETDEAVDELVGATLDLYRGFGEADEIDLAGLATFARRVFDVNMSVDRLEDASQGEEREAIRVLALQARGRYARRGVERLVPDAVEAAFALCVPADRFPTEWECARLREWLRAVGLSQLLGPEDLREETLGEVQGYFVQAALRGHAKRPAEQVRADALTAALQVFLETDLAEDGRNLVALTNAVAGRYGIELDPFELSKMPLEAIRDDLQRRVRRAYERRKHQLGTGNMLWTVRQILLQTTDTKWKDHLYNMDHLRGVIGFRGYGQKDPKVEYKREGYEMFEAMTTSIEDTVADYVLKVEFRSGEEDERSVWQADSFIHEAAEAYEAQQAAAQAPQGGEGPSVRTITATREPGRNDPCPCGKKRPDGRPVKYKNCCGKRKRAS